MDHTAQPQANTVGEILAELSTATAGQFETACAMPPRIYASPEVFSLETEKIFPNEWICVGRTAEISQAGDYLTIDIVDYPVLVVRQQDGTLEAFSNICLHRSTKLVDGCGSSKRFVCPYHAWTYALDGGLVGTRFMEETPGFELSNHRLHRLRYEIWEGFIYVTLNPEIESVAERLTGLQSVIGRYRIADYRHAFTIEERWPANWKCFIDNYMDVYHLFKVHAKTFGKFGHYENLTRLFDGGDHYTYHLVDLRGGDSTGIAHPANDWLDEAFRRTTVLACVFPSHTMQLQPDFLWYVTVQPHGVDQFRIRWSVSVPGEILDDVDDPQGHIEELKAFLSAVNAEDEAIIGRAFAGLRAGTDIRGRLSRLERNVYRFGQYLARKLCG